MEVCRYCNIFNMELTFYVEIVTLPVSAELSLSYAIPLLGEQLLQAANLQLILEVVSYDL